MKLSQWRWVCFIQAKTGENNGAACEDKTAPPPHFPTRSCGRSGSVAQRIQQGALLDCALLPPSSSNPVAALSVGDSHGLWVRLSGRRGKPGSERKMGGYTATAKTNVALVKGVKMIKWKVRALCVCACVQKWVCSRATSLLNGSLCLLSLSSFRTNLVLVLHITPPPFLRIFPITPCFQSMENFLILFSPQGPCLWVLQVKLEDIISCNQQNLVHSTPPPPPAPTSHLPPPWLGAEEHRQSPSILPPAPVGSLSSFIWSRGKNKSTPRRGTANELEKADLHPLRVGWNGERERERKGRAGWGQTCSGRSEGRRGGGMEVKQRGTNKHGVTRTRAHVRTALRTTHWSNLARIRRLALWVSWNAFCCPPSPVLPPPSENTNTLFSNLRRSRAPTSRSPADRLVLSFITPANLS